MRCSYGFLARHATIVSDGETASIELIGIQALQSTELGEPFGRLDLRVPMPESQNESTGSPGEYCFRVAWRRTGGAAPR